MHNNNCHYITPESVKNKPQKTSSTNNSNWQIQHHNKIPKSLASLQYLASTYHANHQMMIHMSTAKQNIQKTIKYLLNLSFS